MVVQAAPRQGVQNKHQPFGISSKVGQWVHLQVYERIGRLLAFCPLSGANAILLTAPTEFLTDLRAVGD
jgi:hypothetical protein